jgi:hypothetical protein
VFRHLSRVALALVIGLTLSLTVSTEAPVHAAALSISVSGNHLVDGNNQPVRLLGVNRSGTEYGCIQGWGIFDGPSSAASVSAIASWPHVNAVRLGLNEDCWLNINTAGLNQAYLGANYQTAIINYVNLLHQYGLYAILELHWTAPGTNRSTQQENMPDADHAPAMWASVAAAFKNDPAVLFDVFNEPNGVSWGCWQNGCLYNGYQTASMQSLVDAVRSSGATNPVMLGGLNFANDLTGWLSHEPSDSANQRVASVHVYDWNPCAGVSCWNSQILPVSQQVPVVTGETGMTTACSMAMVNQYMPWADANAIGYVAWTWDTWGNCGGGLISDYLQAAPTAWGSDFKNHLSSLGATTAPGPPTSVVASGGNGSAVVSWTAPGNGGSPITGYAVSSTPAGGSATVSGSSTSATVSGLSNGTSYTFTVTASNAVGTGPASAPSNAVIPGVPVVVTGVSPSSGPAAGGTVVTITGSGFTGATAVKFGSVAASSFTVSSDTQITATSPAAAPGSVDVTVVVAGRSNPLGPGDRFSYGNLLDVVSTKQYHLSGSDGQSWTDVDGSALSLVIVPTVNEQVVLSGNADLWTATAGVNQDLGIDVNGSLVAWKESGGFAGTFSPNAAYVQTVVTMNAGSSNVVKLRWKSNKATPGSIYAGAGPIGGQYSPTRLTAKLIPVTNGTESHAVSHAQGSLSGNDGSSWVDLDGGAVSTSFIPASAGMALLGGNADLFTGTTGINQDLGIWLSGGTYGSGRVVAWKESGGFAGTFSPNAAFVQTAQPVLAGVTYTVKLQWKANRPENGGTIYAGAGAAAPYSPTGVTVQLLPASALLVASITNQDRLTGSLSDGAQWVPIDPGMPVLSLTPSSNCLALLSGNADLWTATGGYNQDLALSVNGTTIGWKESGGFAGTASPNAAFVQTVLPMNAATTYWMGLRWKANRPAQTATIYAGAGSGLNISPTSLIVEVYC